MLLEFIAEARPGLDQVEHDLLLAERDSDARAECLDRVFRTMHSIKGNGGFLGLRVLVRLAHEAETVMNSLRSGQLEIDMHIMDAIFGATDKLLEYIDLADHSQLTVSDEESLGSAIDPSHEIQALRKSMASDDEEPALEPSSSTDSPPSESNEDSKATAENTESKRYEAEAIDNPTRETSTTQKPLTTSQSAAVAESGSPPRTTSQANIVAQSRPGASDSDQNATVRVSARFLDELLAFTGNMVMARNQLLTRYNFQGDQSFATLSRSITDVHKGVVQQRMQTVGALFGRFHRVVRDLGKKLGKEVDLTIEGEDIELDRTIMEAFTDPLTHMVRNAMDHAIETPEERMAAGKSRVGRLILRAYDQSGEVIVEIEDDGAGMNVDKVAEKAIDKGLVTREQIASWKPRDITRLIFEPGFSTKESASEYSGRGVGMDVVRVNIEKNRREY